jgi:peptidoglycan hydrolase CwlO-like protein
MSGPPGYLPTSGPPGYVPTSGPSYGAPMSGLPDYAAAPPRRGRGALITFAVLTVVLFLASAVLTGLYVTKSGAYDKKVTDLKGRDTTISSLNGQVDDLKKQLQAANDKLDQANQKQTGTQNELDQVTKEKNVISNCLTLLSEAINAASVGNQALAKSKADAAQAPCDEADKYLH